MHTFEETSPRTYTHEIQRNLRTGGREHDTAHMRILSSKQKNCEQVLWYVYTSADENCSQPENFSLSSHSPPPPPLNTQSLSSSASHTHLMYQALPCKYNSHARKPCSGPGHTELESGDSNSNDDHFHSHPHDFSHQTTQNRMCENRPGPADSIQKILNCGGSFPRAGFF